MTELPVRDGHVYRPVDAPLASLEPSHSAAMSYLGFLMLLICGCGGVWFYISGRPTWLEYRERTHRRDMRRRHGIPDHDKRPFSIAYQDVTVKIMQEEDKERNRRAEEEIVSQQNQESPSPTHSSVHDKENNWPDPFYPSLPSASTLRAQASPRSSLRPLIPPSPHVHFVTPPFASTSEAEAALVPDEQPVPEVRVAEFIPPGALPLSEVLFEGSPQPTPRYTSNDLPKTGKKRTASSSYEEQIAPSSTRQVKKSKLGSASYPQAISSTSDVQLDGDEDLIIQEPASMDIDEQASDIRPHGSKRRISDLGSELETVASRRENQKRRLDARHPEDLNRRGMKRERSDIGSILGDVDVDKRHSRKREKLNDSLDDVETLDAIEESDIDEMEDTLTQSPDLDDALPFSADPICQGRRVGEEWEVNKQRYKVGRDGSRLRHTLVKQMRRKFSMPQDSVHPDALQQIEVIVETWLTDDEYRLAKDRQELAWQDRSAHSTASRNFGRKADGKTLLWSSRPGTPTSRDFDDHVPRTTPNPFHDSRKMPNRRSDLAHAVSFSPVRGPQLHKVRSLSKLEKQDIEAAAMARLRQVKSTVKAEVAPVEQPIANVAIPNFASLPSESTSQSSKPIVRENDKMAPPTIKVEPPPKAAPATSNIPPLFSSIPTVTTTQPAQVPKKPITTSTAASNDFFAKHPRGSEQFIPPTFGPLSTTPTTNSARPSLAQPNAQVKSSAMSGTTSFAESPQPIFGGMPASSGVKPNGPPSTNANFFEPNGATPAPLFGANAKPIFGSSPAASDAPFKPLAGNGTASANGTGKEIQSQPMLNFSKPVESASSTTKPDFKPQASSTPLFGTSQIPPKVASSSTIPIFGQQNPGTPLFGASQAPFKTGDSATSAAPNFGQQNPGTPLFGVSQAPFKTGDSATSAAPNFGQQISSTSLFGAGKNDQPVQMATANTPANGVGDSTKATPPSGIFGRAIRRLPPASRAQTAQQPGAMAAEPKPTFSFNFGSSDSTTVPNAESRPSEEKPHAPNNPFGGASFSFSNPPAKGS